MSTRIISLAAAAAAAMTAGLTAVPPSVPAAAAACRPAIIRLPDLGHGGGATAFNGTTVVGLVFDANGRVHPAIWRRGKLTVPVPERSYAHSESFFHQITDDGTVAGTAGPVGGPDRPFLRTCAFQQAYRPSVPSAATTGLAMAKNAAPPAGWQALRREMGVLQVTARPPA